MGRERSPRLPISTLLPSTAGMLKSSMNTATIRGLLCALYAQVRIFSLQASPPWAGHQTTGMSRTHRQWYSQWRTSCRCLNQTTRCKQCCTIVTMGPASKTHCGCTKRWRMDGPSRRDTGGGTSASTRSFVSPMERTLSPEAPWTASHAWSSKSSRCHEHRNSLAIHHLHYIFEIISSIYYFSKI